MKKFFAFALALILALSLLGCAKTDAPAADGNEGGEPASDPVVLTVGASVTPHAEILNAVADKLLADYNIQLKVVEYTDYVQPNLATESGELDANYFQHLPYLESFNEEQGTHLVSVAAIHYEPFSIYPGRSASLDDIPDGAIISVPNDGTNEARALQLLEANGIITLREGAGLSATKLDIVENPHNVEIMEIEAAQLTISLPDVDFACINVNYALQGGLSVAKDALVSENKDSEAAETFANIIAVKEGNEKNEAILALCEVLKSEECRQFIESSYNGEVIPMF